VIEAVRAGADGAVPCVPVADTIKQRGEDGQLVTLERSRLLAAQTPQAFRADVLRAAHARGDEATDDAALVEAIGGRVVSVAGEAGNIKVTNRVDMALAEAALAEAGVSEAGLAGPSLTRAATTLDRRADQRTHPGGHR
jgi:2-C-methyl-D-erythritol 4-phosphate cytidylyltransferase